MAYLNHDTLNSNCVRKIWCRNWLIIWLHLIIAILGQSDNVIVEYSQTPCSCDCNLNG